MHRRSLIKLTALATASAVAARHASVLASPATLQQSSEPPPAIMMAGGDTAWSNHQLGPAPTGSLAEPTFLDPGEAPIHGFQSTLLATPTQVLAFGTFPDDVLAYDRASGNLLWRTQTPLRLNQVASPAFVGNQVFLISGDPNAPGDDAVAPFHVSAIDLASGEVTAWADTFETEFSTRLVIAGSTLLAAGPVGVVAFDTTSGSILWHHELEGAPDVHALLADDTQVIAAWAGEASYQLTSLDIASGEQRVQAPIDGSLRALHDDTILALGRDRLIGYGTTDGAEEWSIPLPIEAPHTLAVDATGVVVANSEAILALDPATSEVTWQTEPGLADPSGYGLTLSGNFLAITGDPGGRWLDRATGETLQDLAAVIGGQALSLRGVAIIDGTIWAATDVSIVRWEGAS